jgi:predicted dehydrogenase
MIRAAIVGLGNWGQRLVDAVDRQSNRIRFVAGVTRTVAKAADFAAARGFPLGDDYAAVLADPAVDAVVLATPHSQHCEQIVRAAAAGKHVYTEKPLTLDRASAERATAACRDAGVVMAVGFNRRFRPAVREVRRLVMEGRLGKLLHLEGDFHGPPLKAPAGCRLSIEENPGGGMTGKGIHIIDAMIWMSGPITSLFAYSDSHSHPGEHRDDTTSVAFRFASGATGMLSTILATPDFWRMHVFGTEGWAEIRDERTLTTRYSGGKPETIEYPDNNSIGEALLCFVDAIEGRDRYPVAFEEAINGAALLEGLERSVASGTAVRLA